MKTGQGRICLVAPGNVASNPRIVKEADALVEAGYRVRVIATDLVPFVRPLDESVLGHAEWECVRISRGGLISHGARVMLHRIARKAGPGLLRRSLHASRWANSALTPQLAAAAGSWPADLYIAHYLPALPAAASAARRHGAVLGFDAEDDHIGEIVDGPEADSLRAARDKIERTYLPQCRHRTAAAPLIAEAYEKRYGTPMATILNVFPLSEAAAGNLDLSQEKKADAPSLYWFSQTISGDRGIEPVVKAMGRMKRDAHLHLRGKPAAGYEAALEKTCRQAGVTGRVHILPSAPPSEMVARSACHDIGLCLEQTTIPNRAICLTNKIFTFLLAGIPLLMSRTPAQEQIAADLGKAARLIDLEDIDGIADTLDSLLQDRSSLEVARNEAVRLGRETYNWDTEKHRFLALVERALSSPMPVPT